MARPLTSLFPSQYRPTNTLWNAQRGRSLTPHAQAATWLARVPGRDLRLPMLMVTVLPPGMSWNDPALADPDVLLACQTAMWAWSAEGRDAAECIAWELALVGSAIVWAGTPILIDIGLNHAIWVEGEDGRDALNRGDA